MARSSARRILLLVGLLVGAIGCTGDPTASPATTASRATTGEPSVSTGSPTPAGDMAVPANDSPQVTEPNPWIELPELDSVAPEPWTPATRAEELTVAFSQGTPTVQDALDAFALTFGEIPGSTESTAPAGEGLPPGYVLDLITSMKEELTAEQAAIVDDVLQPATLAVRFDATGQRTADPAAPPEAPLDTAATTSTQPVGFRSIQAGLPDQAAKDRITKLLSVTMADWRAYRPDLPLSIVDLVFSAEVRNDFAYTTTPNLPDTSICRITVLPLLHTTPQSDNWIHSVLAHELFHCVQKNWNPFHIGIPLWVLEGSADYAMADLYRAKFAPEFPKRNWFGSYEAPLAARSYDAWGLFETVRELGHDPYATAKTLISAGPQGGTLATLALAPELMPLPFRLRWAAKSLRSTEFADPTWSLDWIGPSVAEGPRDNQRGEGLYGIGTFTVYGVGDFGHRAQRIDFHDEVGLVGVVPVGSPIVAYTAGGTVTVAEQRVAKFCFDDSKCVCPAGMSAGAYEMTSDKLTFAFPAIETAPHMLVKSVEWDPKKHCEKKPPATASSNGDPHLVSFDGLPFDVMALGEFVASRDPQGGFEVQTRHAPFESGFAGTTAVAVSDGVTRLTLTVDRFEGDAQISERVNGVESASLPAGGLQVVHVNDEWTITWPDGSVVRATWATGWFLTFEIEPERASRSVGLLGSANGNLFDDLQLPNGTPIDATPAAIDEDFATAWAVDDPTSLFDYRSGESAATFRKATAARFAPRPDPDASDHCTTALGVTATSYEIEACANDVAATDDETFVEQYTSVTLDRSATGETTRVFPEFAADADAGSGPATGTPSTDGARSALTLDGVLYDGISDPGRVDAVASFDGAITVVEGSVVVVRATACPTGFAGLINVELTPITLDREVTIASGSSILCDGIGLKSAIDSDAVVANETYLWVPVGGTYAVAVTATEGGPFPMKVELFTDPTPTVLDIATSIDRGYAGDLSGVADTVVLQVDGDQPTTLVLAGLTDACVVDAYGASTPGDGGPWDLSICKHLSELSIGPTFGTPLIVVVFNRTGRPEQVRVAPQP